jgi:transcriptional regulator with XRE-family HTH domain
MSTEKELTNEQLKKLLSKKLALLRQKNKQTIEATALDLGMNFSEYYRLLKGDRLPHLLTLLKINRKYDLNMDWWFSELKNKTAAQNIHKKAEDFLLLSNYHKLDEQARQVVLDMLKNLAKNRQPKKLHKL